MRLEPRAVPGASSEATIHQKIIFYRQNPREGRGIKVLNLKLQANNTAPGAEGCAQSCEELSATSQSTEK